MAARCVLEEELQKFRRLQSFWWDPTGPLRTLHHFNGVRVGYIQRTAQQFGRALHGTSRQPPAKVLDIGCGGGLLSLALARVGADVMGIDACAESVHVALAKKEEVDKRLSIVGGSSPLMVDFQSTNLFDVKEKYDIVIASEVIEHVDDPASFLAACCDRAQDGGLVIISTMEKSLCTLASHILGAEYVLGIVPPGTHDWTKFIPSTDLTKHALRHAVRNVDLTYIIPSPSLSRSIALKNIEIDFKLTPNFNGGHYFWTGLKTPRTAQTQSDPTAQTE